MDDTDIIRQQIRQRHRQEDSRDESKQGGAYVDYSQPNASLRDQLVHHTKRKPGDWKKDKATSRQIAYLRSLGYQGNDPRSKAHAGWWISILESKTI